jgi:hypothetical protein
MDYVVGQIVEVLPETRGGPLDTKDIDDAFPIAQANPGKWVVALENEPRPNARNWIIRKHPELMVATRQLEHNTEGRVTVFIMYPRE